MQSEISESSTKMPKFMKRSESIQKAEPGESMTSTEAQVVENDENSSVVPAERKSQLGSLGRVKTVQFSGMVNVFGSHRDRVEHTVCRIEFDPKAGVMLFHETIPGAIFVPTASLLAVRFFGPEEVN